MPGNAQQRVRFGDFELNLQSGELQRSGFRRRLPRQSFRILTILLQHPGEVVTREELRNDLWPDDTFVDFEHGLNSAVRRLRDALNDSADEPKFVETLPRLGYRYLGPPVTPPGQAEPVNGTLFIRSSEAWKVLANQPADATLKSEESPEAKETRFPLRRVRIIAAAAVTAVMILTAGILRWRMERSAEVPVHSLAVLPLRNLSGNPEQEYLTDGMTDELITDLAKMGTIRVISLTSVMSFKGTQKSVREIGRELNVDAVIEGTVQTSPGRIHISAQLVQVQPEKHLWAESYDRPLVDAVALQEELASEIARAVRFKVLPQQQARLDRKISPEAFQLYLKGRYFWNKRTEEGFQQAISYFQQAITKQPNYAEAYAGLADSYLLLGSYGFAAQSESVPKARAATQKVLELDSSLADAHATLGLIAENYDWDWAEAERQYRQAILLNPNYATAHHWYGEYLGLLGRFDEGLAEIQLAESLDPLSVIISTDHSGLLLWARQYDKAISQFQKTLEMDSNFYPARTGLLLAELYRGTATPPTFAGLERLQSPANPAERDAILAYAYARTGRRAEAEKILRHLKELGDGKHIDDGAMVIVYLGLGDKKHALAYMEKEYAEHSPDLNSMRVNPLFDPLRSDPGFTDLMRRVRLI